MDGELPNPPGHGEAKFCVNPSLRQAYGGTISNNPEPLGGIISLGVRTDGNIEDVAVIPAHTIDYKLEGDDPPDHFTLTRGKGSIIEPFVIAEIAYPKGGIRDQLTRGAVRLLGRRQSNGRCGERPLASVETKPCFRIPLIILLIPGTADIGVEDSKMKFLRLCGLGDGEEYNLFEIIIPFIGFGISTVGNEGGPLLRPANVEEGKEQEKGQKTEAYAVMNACGF